MTPDSALIAEIMLFAEGFANTKVFSKKIDTLYRLASQQLSKQDHYDFNLRSLTAALRSAGNKKRLNPTLSDEVVLYMAMQDNNIPKLTENDVPLFTSILTDLFPSLEVANVEILNFKSCVVQALQEEKLCVCMDNKNFYSFFQYV
jgi:dynein heavy chain